MTVAAIRHMLVYRDYKGFTGGHGKFRDYVAHVDAHPNWQADVYLSPSSMIDESNPFLDVPNRLDRWLPEQADAILVGGGDWAVIPSNLPEQLPIVNLVQHVRHGEPGHALRAFLGRRAIRVGNSSLVAEAVLGTGEANGPVVMIPSGLDIQMLAEVGAVEPTADVFIDAAKQPKLGREVADLLVERGLKIELLIARVPFPAYLRAMASAPIAVTLPDATEGLYLPGLNAMAMGRLLVQPDCVGSREYVRDGENALQASREPQALADAALHAHEDVALRARLVSAGRSTAARFDLATERQAVHALLDALDDLWTA